MLIRLCIVFCFILLCNDIVLAQKEFSPNPFSPDENGMNDSTSISLTLEAPEKVSLWICDLTGRVIRILAENKEMSSGDIVWDGKNDQGNIVKIGVYLYILKTGTGVSIGTVVVTK